MNYIEQLQKNKIATAGALVGAGIGIYFWRKFIAGGVNTHVPDLTGKLALITGGTTGLGYETAKNFAKLKAEVILTARSDEKGRKAVERLRRETGNYRIDYLLLELSSFKSIHNFVQEFKKRGQVIDFLINNAGVLAPPYTLTEEGFELQFGVNYMGHFLLTNLILRENLMSDRSRIVCLSSHGHYSGKINFDDLNWTKKYSGYYAYAQSKLANILFARELDRRLKEQGQKITAVSCHPGMVTTEMGRHMPWYITALLFPITYPLSKTPPQGAQTTMYCALAPEVAELGGAYFADCKHHANCKHHAKPSPDALDDNLAKKLWEHSEQLAKLV